MPFVRISLHKELNEKVKNQISLCVHQALMQKFLIPENDYFHIIEELDANQIKYPKEYLGIKHTDRMVFLQIIAGSGRTENQKRELYAEIGKSISATTEISINDIIIILIESDSYYNWSFGMGKIQKLTHIK